MKAKGIISALAAFLTGTALMNAQEVSLQDCSRDSRYSLGSTTVIKGEDLEKYTSADIRNALAGLAPGVEVQENYDAPGVTALEHTGEYSSSTQVSVSSRGKGFIYLLDGIQVRINETPLDPQQIESITIIRDPLEKNLYGPTAADGIVYIKTRRGNGDHYFKASAESGVKVVDRTAEFVGAADYARLNNIARNNSGLTMLYTSDDVQQYSKGNPYDLVYPSVDFRSMLLKSTRPYTKAVISTGGGNANFNYFTALGYTGEGDNYKMGADSRYDRMNINANLSVKLHERLRADFGFLSTMTVRKSPHYGYNSSLANEFTKVISEVNTTPGLAFPIYAYTGEELEYPWYGVSTSYTQNPIANITETGSYTETTRKGLINVGLDFDLGFLVKGLSSYTKVAYDVTNLVRLGTTEDYAAYILEKEVDFEDNVTTTPVKSSSHTVISTSDKSKLLDYFSNRLYLSENLSYEKKSGKHDFKAVGGYMITKRSQKFITEHRREINWNLSGQYVYDDRFIAQAVLNEHGTYSLLDCWSFSPSFGLGWIASNEDWMKGKADFLKFRLDAGFLRYDSCTSAGRDVDNYKFDNNGRRFGPHSNNQWFGSGLPDQMARTSISIIGNPELELEKRYELTAGADYRGFSDRLSASLSWWYSFTDGPIAAISNTIPGILGLSTGSYYLNLAQTARTGAELNLGWKDKIGGLEYSIQGWAASNFSRIVSIDELPYPEPYRTKVGKSATAIWGLYSIGQFASDEEAMAENQLYDDVLHKGDLKYQDMNGDGQINDQDICVIGDSSPKLIYALNLNLKYRNFDFSLVGTGRAFYQLQLTNSYYWNGWGDGNYSEFTYKHASDPSYPGLYYNKVNNNYKLSSFWLTDGGYFNIQTAEIGYTLKFRKAMESMRLYLRANNLATATAVKDLDPEALSAGLTNYPLMRSFVGGIKMSF